MKKLFWLKKILAYALGMLVVALLLYLGDTLLLRTEPQEAREDLWKAAGTGSVGLLLAQWWERQKQRKAARRRTDGRA